MITLFFVISVLTSFNVLKIEGYTAYCGPYTLVAKLDEPYAINGEHVTSQNDTYLGKDGIQVDLELIPAKDGNNYRFQYVHLPETESRYLSVERLQNSTDAPKEIITFSCKKVFN